MILSTCARPFLGCFFRPVVKTLDPGRCEREPFLCVVVKTMVSLSPVFLLRMSRTFAAAIPLNFDELSPMRLPGSADIVGMFGHLRRNALFFRTHSQINCGAADILQGAGRGPSASEAARASGRRGG